jgi:hypothetical protein
VRKIQTENMKQNTNMNNSAKTNQRAAQGQNVRVRKTPNCAHLYTATIKGQGTYGFGDTPDEARQSLTNQLEHSASQNVRTANDNYALYEADRVAKREAQTEAKPAHTAETLEVWRQRAVDEANKVSDREVVIAELLAACKEAVHRFGRFTFLEAAIAKVEAGQ